MANFQTAIFPLFHNIVAKYFEEFNDEFPINQAQHANIKVNALTSITDIALAKLLTFVSINIGSDMSINIQALYTSYA
jgi:hypothetical protein